MAKQALTPGSVVTSARLATRSATHVLLVNAMAYPTLFGIIPVAVVDVRHSVPAHAMVGRAVGVVATHEAGLIGGPPDREMVMVVVVTVMVMVMVVMVMDGDGGE